MSEQLPPRSGYLAIGRQTHSRQVAKQLCNECRLYPTRRSALFAGRVRPAPEGRRLSPPGHGSGRAPRARRRDIHDADTAPVGTLRPAAGDVDQDVPHQPRRDCQEVGAVLPTDVTPVHQADKRFVHQRGRLKHVAGPLAPEVSASDLAQFRKQGGPMTRMAGSLVALSIVLLATSNARADDVTDWNETGSTPAALSTKK